MSQIHLDMYDCAIVSSFAFLFANVRIKPQPNGNKTYIRRDITLAIESSGKRNAHVKARQTRLGKIIQPSTRRHTRLPRQGNKRGILVFVHANTVLPVAVVRWSRFAYIIFKDRLTNL